MFTKLQIALQGWNYTSNKLFILSVFLVLTYSQYLNKIIQRTCAFRTYIHQTHGIRDLLRNIVVVVVDLACGCDRFSHQLWTLQIAERFDMCSCVSVRDREKHVFGRPYSTPQAYGDVMCFSGRGRMGDLCSQLRRTHTQETTPTHSFRWRRTYDTDDTTQPVSGLRRNSTKAAAAVVLFWVALSRVYRVSHLQSSSTTKTTTATTKTHNMILCVRRALQLKRMSVILQITI